MHSLVGIGYYWLYFSMFGLCKRGHGLSALFRDVAPFQHRLMQAYLSFPGFDLEKLETELNRQALVSRTIFE